MDDYKRSGSYRTVYILRPVQNFVFALALCLKLLEWTEIENLVHIQRKHQQKVIEHQVDLFKKEEKCNRIYFWTTIAIFLSGYVVCGTYDILECMKFAMRVYDASVLIVLATIFIAVQPRMCRTTELSAHDAYLSHKTRFRWTLITVVLVILGRAGIEFSFAIINDPHTNDQERTNLLAFKILSFLYDAIGLVPVYLYTLTTKSDEDCL